MEALLRRRKILVSELERDIPELEQYLKGKDVTAIKHMAHKYKVRLDYFGYTEALDQCISIIDDYLKEQYDAVLQQAESFLVKLKTILKAGEDESINS